MDIGKSLAAVERIGFYLAVPRAKVNYPFTRAKDKEPTVLTGIAATHLVEWSGKPQLSVYTASSGGVERANRSRQRSSWNALRICHSAHCAG